MNIIDETNNAKKDFIISQITERNIRFIRLWFTDVIGSLKSIAIAPAELESAINNGIAFDGSSVEGLSRISESDMLLKPNLDTFQVLPWRGGNNGAARMFAEIVAPDGSPTNTDPRAVLTNIVNQYKSLGYEIMVHPEIEFYLFKNSENFPENLEPIDRGGYYDQLARSKAIDFRKDAITTLEEMDIPVALSHHEAGAGQNEIDLHLNNVLQTADNIISFRTVVKQIALESNVVASFMPKPLDDAPGSGMHTHFTLFSNGENMFYDEQSGFYKLSPLARQFMAGILDHALEISAVTNQFVNSYKRLWAGAEAPSFVSWGHNNRSSLLRVPLTTNDKLSARVEIRSIDSSANPYLAYAAILAAGLDGINRGLELPAEANNDANALTEIERKALGIKPLPQTLREALNYFQNSEFMAKVLGEKIFDYFISNKTDEWNRYNQAVSKFEIDELIYKL
ncbi:MAG: type I glutamate--ammonia ligase [Bifidobacteriaceae bacterium]|jgi:glutamine synthetase|nr:type I glutamate--ammonia ligase [Bifidobacteriaceae bacterium]